MQTPTTDTKWPRWAYGLPAALGLFWAALVLYQASVLFGGPRALLRVGTLNPLFAAIELELGSLPTNEKTGHDGQLFYAVARDPLGRRGTPDALAVFDDNGPQYRYRRILYPLLAGGFGQLAGQQTLWGMLLLVLFAFAFMGLALADLASRWNVSGQAVIVALANPGLFVAAWTLEADPLAVALALGGVALVTRERWRGALVLFALAALTKETYLLVPWGVAAWLWATQQRHRAVAFALAPALPLASWSTYLWFAMPSGHGVQNLGLPLRGIWRALPLWIAGERSPAELLSLLFAGVVLWRGARAISRVSLLGRWLISPWLLVALTASVDVWGKPNNAARTVALLWPLTIVQPRIGEHGG